MQSVCCNSLSAPKVLLRVCLASRAEVCLFLADEGELEQFKHPE